MLKRMRRLFGKPTGKTAPAVAAPAEPVQADSPVSADAFVMPFDIRPMTGEDGPALRELFRQSIQQIASKHYDADAIAAWSASADDADFVTRLQHGLTLVALLHGEAVGFAQLQPASHIEMMYLSPQGSGLGIATLLCQHLEDEARIAGSKTLTTASSLAARRFFESMGFRVVAEETAQRNGVAINRLQMEKVLVASQAGHQH